MQIIKQGYENAVKLIKKKKLDTLAEYRLSLYSYPYTENGRYVIGSCLTGQVFELTETEWNAVNELRHSPRSYAYLEEKGLVELAKERYIVETDYDDVERYLEVIKIIKMTSLGKKGLKSYIIFPTTGCNARCVYCYEKGYAVKNMSIETADRLVDYICETKSDDFVKLNWFGGEPL
ncbi:MAG: hypothetical protein K6B74_03220, partial [Ruminococcus sp.]|nr:hypothetical protein [Ruminococcus sp.]